MEMVNACSLDGYKVYADGIRGYDSDSGLGRVETWTMLLVGELTEAVGRGR